MFKRILSVFLLLCIIIQTLPLTVFAEALDSAEPEETITMVIPESFQIISFDISKGIATILSPEERTASVIVAQYKNGETVSVNAADADLTVGKNTITIPDYTVDDTATMKVMLWNNIDQMSPLCDAFEIGARILEVNFDTGNSGLTVSKRTYPSNALFGKLPSPIADGYLFVGWYYDEEFENLVLEDDLVVDSCTLYAKMINLASLYKDGDTIFTERYVAYIDALPGTKVLVLSDDATMSANDVLSSIIVENLSVPDKAGKYTVKFCTVENYADISLCEEEQQRWLSTAEKTTGFFVFSAEGGFAEGNSYRITLNDDRLSFAGHSATARDYNLSVIKEQMSNLTLRDDIIFVDESLINEVTDEDESEVQLLGISTSGTSGKATNRFSLGTGESGEKLILSNTGGKLEIVSGNSGETVPGSIIISGDEDAKPEHLNDKTVAVYGHNSDEFSLLDAEDLLLPEKLTLDGSALWTMDYRTIEGQIDGDYVYTESKGQNILFKPDIFPMLELEGKEVEVGTEADKIKATEIVFHKEIISSKAEITIPADITISAEKTISAKNTTVSYDQFGITDSTTLDAGDFIVFLSEDEKGSLVCTYAKVYSVEEDENGNYTVAYVSADEEDVLSSMDMYGERDLSAEELTGRDNFEEVEEEAELQALNSGFADNAAMYVSSVMVASEAFADLSKEYDLNFEEIRNELAEAVDSGDFSLLEESKDIIYKSNNGALIVYKPKVVAEVDPSFEVNGAVKGGVMLTLNVSGDIEIRFGSNTKSTITISYGIEFVQTVRAEITMNAEADIHYILWIIPVIDDCTINANIDFYTSSDVKLNITAGLTSESDGSTTKEVWYAPTSGKRYHVEGCTHDIQYIKRIPIEDASTTVNNGIVLTPCERCNPDNSGVDTVWYATTSGEKYHVKGCTHDIQYIKYISIEEARKTVNNGEKLLPCERCQPEEKVYVLPYGECYHRKNCSYLKDKSNGTPVACTIPVAKESGNYRPCSSCCPGELLAENVTAELEELLGTINNIRENLSDAVSNVQDFQTKLEEVRANLNGGAPQEPSDAKADEETETLPASLVAEKKLIERYQTLLSNSYSDWAEIYRLNLFSANVFSFWGLINVSVAMDFCLYANLNVSIKANLHYENAKRYIFTIHPFEGKVTQNVLDLVPEQLEFDFLAMGTAGLKMGIELAIGINFISDDIGQVSITGEVGLYIKMWGYFKYHYNNVRPLNEPPSCHGALYLEIGPYIDVGFSASLLNRHSWNPSLYYQEFPLLTTGERNVVLGFEDSDDIEYLRLRKNRTSLALTKDIVSVAYMDLRTGKTGTTAYLNDLKTAQPINNIPFAYASKRYTVIINNDDNDSAFQFDPASASVIVKPDGDPEEAAELVIIYNQPEFSFNRTAVTKKINLYWDTYGDAHTLWLDPNGGNYLAPIIELSGKKIQLPTPVRPGYIFEGWSDGVNIYNNPSDGENATIFDIMPEVDSELRAVWTPGMTTYTVNHWQYDLKGIPQLCDTESFEARTESEVTPAPMTYKGFVIPTEITARVEGDGSTVVDYYYEREIYLYTLHVQDQTTYRMVRYGAPIVLTGREVAGYEFQGWFDSDDKETGKSIFELLNVEETTGALAFNYEFDHDLALYARLEPLTTTPYLIEFYTYQQKQLDTGSGDAFVTYVEQLGSLQCQGVTDTIADLTKNPDELELVKIYEDNKDTGNFWFKPAFNLEKWDYYKGYADEVATGTINGYGTLVLRVYYEKAKRSITYKDGSFSVPSGDFEVGEKIPTPPTTSKTGYTFGGWEYYSNDGENDILAHRAEYSDGEWTFDSPIYMPRTPYTTKAIWTPNKYTVTLYNYEGAEKHTVDVTYDKELPEITPPVRDGYVFNGYFKDLTKYYDADGKAAIEKYTDATDIELRADWEIIGYNINYVLNDSAIATVTKPNETSYTVEKNVVFKDLTRTGYTFEGWYTTADFAQGSEITSTEGYTEDLTVYAKWSPIEYTITYVWNDDDSVAKVNDKDKCATVYSVENKVNFANPTRTSYIFEGWFTTADFAQGSEITSTEGYTEDLTVYAKWSPIEYTITYVWNDDDSVAKVNDKDKCATVYSVENKVNFANPTRTSYIFEGWFTTADFAQGSEITSTEDYTENLTVYAKWNGPKENTIRYELNGGTNNSANITQYTIKDTEWKMYAPNRLGYTFNTWISKTEGVEVTKATSTTTVQLWIVKDNRAIESRIGEIVFTADWTPNKYTIVYDLNQPDASKTAEINRTKTDSYGRFVDEGVEYDKLNGHTLANAKLTGWTMDGWKLGNTTYPNGATVNNLTAQNGAEVVLIAQWTLIEYHATWEVPAKASITVVRTSSPNAKALSIGDVVYYDDVLKITYSSDTGYSIAKHGKETITVNGDVTKDHIFATAEPNKYTVIYDLNKPSNASHDVYCTEPQTDWIYDFDGTLPTPTLTGWSFGGWFFDQSFEKLAGGSGEKVKNLAAEGSVTLYAKWTANKYTVKYDLNKPSNASHDVYCTEPQTDWIYDFDGTLPSPTLTGWTMDGWFFDQNFEKRAGGSGEKVKNLTTDESVTLYAKWTPNKYTVAYEKNKPDDASGNVICSNEPINWTYDVNYVLPTPTLTGWTFGGWKKANDDIILKTDKPVGNLTADDTTVVLIAQWSRNEYTVVFDPGYGDGSDAGISSETRDYQYDIKPASYIPTRKGWVFLGWKDENGKIYDGSAESLMNLTAQPGVTVKLTAQWKCYTVTLDKQGGTGGTQNYYYLYDTSALNSRNEDIYYYKDSSCSVNNAFVDYTIEVPSKTGYAFDGYYTKTNGQGTQYVDYRGVCINNLYMNSSKDITLYAYWRPVRTVTLNKQGGTGGTDYYYYLYNSTRSTDSGTTIYYYKDTTCQVDKAFTNYTIAVPAKTGCKFGGYYTATNGQGTQYVNSEGVCVNNLYESIDGNVTLYADWIPIKYTITYDLNKSSIKTTPSCASATTYGYYKKEYSYFDTLCVPSAPYYEFDGWWTAASGGSKVTDTTVMSTAKNHTLYAHWKQVHTDYTYIGNKTDLKNIKNTGKYMLVNNISSIGAWTPISTFSGTLEGNDKTLSGITITVSASSKSSNEFYGLFGINNGVINNLNIADSKISMGSAHGGDGWVFAGIVCGCNNNIVSNVDVTNTRVEVHRDKSEIGGLIGTNNGTVKNSTAKTGCYIYGNGDMGGIVGGLTGTVDSCTVDGITVKNYIANNARCSGGAVGYSNKGTIKNTAVVNTKMILAADSVNVDGFLGDNSPDQGWIVGHQNGGVISRVGGGADSGCTKELENYDLKNWIGKTYNDGYFNVGWGWAGRISNNPSVS